MMLGAAASAHTVATIRASGHRMRGLQCSALVRRCCVGALRGGGRPRLMPRLAWRQDAIHVGGVRAMAEDGTGGPTETPKILPEANPGNLRIVLVNPQIPGNTGTIARTCAATGVPLHLVGPLGFSVDDKAVKRAGLDYWEYVFVKEHESWDSFFEYFKEQEGPKRLIGFSKSGAAPHTEDGAYRPGDWLLFGAWEQCRAAEYGGGLRRIPIVETHVRSLNLAVSAGIGVYEALRQTDLALAKEE